MKKITLLIMLCVGMFNVTDAYSQIRFGVRGGVDVIDNDINSNMLKLENRMGYQLGASVDLKIPIIGIGVETGALFGQKSYKDGDIQLQLSENVNTPLSVKNYNYVQVPLYLKQSFTLFGMAGVYVKGGVYGNIKVSGGDVMAGDANYGGSKRLQKGLAAGAGVVLINHLELGMNYQHRLEDPYSSNMDAFNKLGRNTWTVTLAYYL